ncbi:hypothetical protein BB561_003415 [Smittium simulii]|uniref:RNase H type-1 domain-containing protein n=1 Tax=Smittium simulii TaxID=133385 RepID=A0A2T9YLJ2_9FUNG|nr:hypothetical protein BB561_003415 [Smittium simulii]
MGLGEISVLAHIGIKKREALLLFPSDKVASTMIVYLKEYIEAKENLHNKVQGNVGFQRKEVIREAIEHINKKNNVVLAQSNADQTLFQLSFRTRKEFLDAYSARLRGMQFDRIQKYKAISKRDYLYSVELENYQVTELTIKCLHSAFSLLGKVVDIRINEIGKIAMVQNQITVIVASDEILYRRTIKILRTKYDFQFNIVNKRDEMIYSIPLTLTFLAFTPEEIQSSLLTYESSKGEQEQNEETWEVYTDGSAQIQRRSMSWGGVFTKGPAKKQHFMCKSRRGYISNNLAEYYGILTAIYLTPLNAQLTVYSDSTSAMRLFEMVQSSKDTYTKEVNRLLKDGTVLSIWNNTKNYIKKRKYPVQIQWFESLSDSNDIDSNDIDSNDIDSNDIDSNDIDSNDIDSNDIDSNDIDSNDIDSNDIDSNDIDSNDIDSNDIDSNDIDSNDIDSNDIDSNDIDSNDIDSNDIDSNDIDSNDIDSNDIDSNDIDSNDIDSNDIDSNDIDSNDIDSNDIDSNDIDSNDIDSIKGETGALLLIRHANQAKLLRQEEISGPSSHTQLHSNSKPSNTVQETASQGDINKTSEDDGTGTIYSILRGPDSFKDKGTASKTETLTTLISKHEQQLFVFEKFKRSEVELKGIENFVGKVVEVYGPLASGYFERDMPGGKRNVVDIDRILEQQNESSDALNVNYMTFYTDTWFYFVETVEIIGLITLVEQKRKFTRFAIDDGTGLLEAIKWYTAQEIEARDVLQDLCSTDTLNTVAVGALVYLCGSLSKIEPCNATVENAVPRLLRISTIQQVYNPNIWVVETLEKLQS